MAVSTQAPLVVSPGGAETELRWSVTTDEAEFRSRPAREGEVRVLDRSALITAQHERRAVFLAAQIEGQKIYKRD